MLWNFNRFDINSSIWVKEAWEAKKYAFVADYIRLYAVYNYGGIYLDMDVEVIKPFDDLLQRDIMIAREDDIGKSVESACFGAEQHSPYIKHILDYYSNRHFIKPDGSYDSLPIPFVMRDLFRASFPEIESIFYTSEYFSPRHYWTHRLNITANTYAIHHGAASWVDDEDKKQGKITAFLCRTFGMKLGREMALFYYGIRHIPDKGLSWFFSRIKRKLTHESS
jgi:mannosyltransferase OCH1-like enzyme